jgi:apolipoprotein N-acyltransferase
VSVLRAVESDRPVVVASNMGPSEIIDANGRVVARAPSSSFFAPAHVTATVHLPSGQTPYRRYGDWTWALPFGIVVLAIRRRPRRS